MKGSQGHSGVFVFPSPDVLVRVYVLRFEIYMLFVRPGDLCSTTQKSSHLPSTFRHGSLQVRVDDTFEQCNRAGSRIDLGDR